MDNTLTPQARLQIKHTVEETIARLDRRLQKLTVDLESIQTEVNDLRAIRSTLQGVVELLRLG